MLGVRHDHVRADSDDPGGNGTRIAYTTLGGTKIFTSAISVDLNEEIAVGTETVPTTGYSQVLTFTWVSN